MKTNTFRDLKPLRYNSGLGSRRWSALNALLGAVVIDRSPSERDRARVPVTEAEFDAVIAHEWKDPVKRNKVQLIWQREGCFP